jgi:hypothetical protein
MTDKTIGRIHTRVTVETQVPFRFRIVHGEDPSRKSAEQKAVTKSLGLAGLVFEASAVELDGFHISFTEASFGRNFMEIDLDLGRKFPGVSVIGQVEWYENRPGPRGAIFIIGVSFVDLQADAAAILRQFIGTVQSLAR